MCLGCPHGSRRGRPYRWQRYRELSLDPARSENQGMYGTSMRENREIPSLAHRVDHRVGRPGNLLGTPGMNEGGKSDDRVVPANPPNKVTAAAGTAEVGEERRSAKGNTASKTPPGHRAGPGVSNALDRVREAARRDKGTRFTALLHHVDLPRLRKAYRAIRPKAAPGVDGVTWTGYGQDLEANLQDLHARVQSGRYRAKPSRRVYIVRREALRRIPRAAGRNLEGGFWVHRLTRCRKVDGTGACRGGRGLVKAPKRRTSGTRVIWQRLDCLKSNLYSVITRTHRKGV